MAEVEIVMSLLAALVVLLFLCWVSLRAIGSKLDSLFYTIHGFMRYSEQQNGLLRKRECRWKPWRKSHLLSGSPKIRKTRTDPHSLRLLDNLLQKLFAPKKRFQQPPKSFVVVDGLCLT